MPGLTASHAFDLFPKPSRPAFELKTLPPPRRLGRTPASTAALLDILKDNSERWHIFFNKLKYHNHSAATALARWSLGANQEVLKASYGETSTWQRPLDESPNRITSETWKDHLGDITFYKAYIDFFIAELREKGTQRLLEEYIFSREANFPLGPGVKPQMLNRTFDSIMHPMINIGNGLEFNLPRMVVDGLAQVAIHRTTSSTLITADWWDPDYKSELDHLQRDNFHGFPTKMDHPKGLHPLNILARMLKDPEMGNFTRPKGTRLYDAIMASHGEKIRAYANQLHLHDDLEKNIEEMMWFWTLLYGVCGNELGRRFNAELFLAHCVTSAIFLGPWVAHVSDRSARLFLRAYFSVCLAWYVGRGRPPLDIARFFTDSSSLRPDIPGPRPTPANGILKNKDDLAASITPNLWFPILQETLVHPDEHVPKLQRALKHFAELFEDVEKGYFKDSELEGAELIDGTLFLRTSVLSANRFGWLRAGQSLSDYAVGNTGFKANFVWDAYGFFKQNR